MTRVAVCGTRSGYRKHQRLGEVTCQPCRDANTAYVQGRAGPVRENLPCGTRAAYRRHLRAGQRPCEACLEANREAARLARRGA